MTIKINATKLLCTDIVELENETKGGIILPSAVLKKDSTRGKVIAVGEGTADIKIPYAIGDTVLYPPKAGRTFHYEDKEYRLVDVAEILMGGL